MTLTEIAATVGGRVISGDAGLTVTGKVEFDSRRVGPGDLFLAIQGEQADGHDYAGAAVAAGAVAVLGTRQAADVAGRPVATVLVEDPIDAVSALARAQAARLRATVIGITGSAGKTSTKDLVAQVLAGHGVTVSPPESFNNELGYPYTVLLADERTDYLVLEASARGIGHIAHLMGIAAPSIAAVLNVGTAHLAEFGSRAAIAQAKGELVEALPVAGAGGVAVLNADDPLVLAMAARTSARVVTVGERADADLRAEKVSLDDAGRPAFELVTGSHRVPVRLTLTGQHQVSNALAAAGIALACGMRAEAVAEALSAATARSRWRMEITESAAGVTVVNDAYNANPESMRAALTSLAVLAAGRRSVAVLAQMAELGSASEVEHHQLGAFAASSQVDRLLVIGEQARPILPGASSGSGWRGSAEWLPDIPAALRRLPEVLEPGDVLLVKGSRAAGLERVAAGVIEWLDSVAARAGAGRG